MRYFVLTLLTFAMWQSAFSQSQDGLNLYRHSLYSFQYPKTWTIDTTGDMGPAVILFSPFSANGNRCYVSISTQPQPGESVSRDSMIRANIGFLPYSIEGFQLIGSDTFDLNGQDAFEMTYEGKQNGNEYRWRQTGMVTHGQLYMITFAATPSGFKEFDAEAKVVSSGFKVTEPQ